MNESNWIDRGARLLIALIIGILMLAAMGFFSSCTRTVYVPVKEVQTVYQNHTDTVHRTDSIIKERETIVMQLDSQAMSEYGIKLDKAEKAWLVREKELESKINKLLEKKADTLIVRDSIQVPYPIEKPLSTIQKVWMKLGKLLSGVSFCALFLILVYIFAIKRK